MSRDIEYISSIRDAETRMAALKERAERVEYAERSNFAGCFDEEQLQLL